jgi:hypothetical protein
VTIDLDLLLKIVFFFLNLSSRVFFRLFPKKVKMNTLVIIPDIVTKMVSQNPYPAANPSTGPAMNLNKQRK